MVATTQVWFLVGANYGVDFKKNPLTGETGFRGFSKPGEGFLFLMKTVGAVLPPHRLSFVAFLFFHLFSTIAGNPTLQQTFNENLLVLVLSCRLQ
jgi:hypothetical protein